jgi:arginine exporter protein ArgO
VQATVSTSWYMTLVAAVNKASVFLARPAVRRSLTAVSAIGIMLLAIALGFTSSR